MHFIIGEVFFFEIIPDYQLGLNHTVFCTPLPITECSSVYSPVRKLQEFYAARAQFALIIIIVVLHGNKCTQHHFVCFASIFDVDTQQVSGLNKPILGSRPAHVASIRR